MQKGLGKLAALLGGLALAAALAGYWSVRHRALEAVETARTELAGQSAGARTVYSGDFPGGPAAGSVRTVTRLSPVNAAAWFEGSLAVGTEGGLALLGPAPSLLTAAQGLAGTGVSSLARLGELLVAGTNHGVSVLGGGALRSYRFADPPANRVRCLWSDGREVWIGTEGGVIRYDGRDFTYHPAFPRHDLMVTSLAKWGEAAVAGTWKSGVIAVFPDRELNVGASEGLAEPITALLDDGKRLLIGTPLGLAEWKEGAPPKMLLDEVSVAGLERQGDAIAIATWDQGLKLLAGGRARTVLMGQSLRALGRADGRLWAASESGLFIEKGDGFEEAALPSPGPSLSDNRLTAAAMDESGRLWLGTFDRGVDVLGPDLAAAAHLAEPGFEDVNCIRAGGDGKMYVGAGRGLLIYSGLGLSRMVTARDGLIGEAVFDVVEDPAGGLVIATGSGITFLGPARAQSVSVFHGLVNNHVYALAWLDQRLAAGTLGGLSLLSGVRVMQNLGMGNSDLRHNWITALVPAGPGLYVGTFGGGVALLNQAGQVKSLDIPRSGADVNNHAMLMVSERLLVGSFGGGLLIYRPDPGEWSSASQRLTSPNVTGLAVFKDGAGNERLVIATDRGLNVLDPAELIQ